MKSTKTKETDEKTKETIKRYVKIGDNLLIIPENIPVWMQQCIWFGRGSWETEARFWTDVKTVFERHRTDPDCNVIYALLVELILQQTMVRRQGFRIKSLETQMKETQNRLKSVQQTLKDILNSNRGE